MRRTILLLVIMSLTLLLASGLALAAEQIDCSDSPAPLCVGTPNSDEIEGTDTPDDIRARAGNDVVKAGADDDLVYGQRGAGLLLAGHCANDSMVGGAAMTRSTSAMMSVIFRLLWVGPALRAWATR
jgi:Ca2+-binding RTX toxin-like protein